MLTTGLALAQAPTVEPKTTPRTCETVQECVDYYGDTYGVSKAKLEYIILGESGGNPFLTGDMNIICKRTGKPVRSRGIIQISECYYPEISDECAYTVECALDKMILLIKDDKTCKSQWTTCRNYFSVDK